MNKVTGSVIFAAGVAIGSAVTWYFTKKKYEQIAQEEINSVKDVFSKNAIKNESSSADISKEDLDNKKAGTMENEKMNVAEYAKRLSKEGYTDYSKSGIMVDDEEEEEDSGDPGPEPESYFGDPDAEPYVIPPEEFGEKDDYDRVSLSYYSDQILADDDDQLLEDVEDTIGFESLTRFGEYEDDSVYVRNDRLKTDYEILRDERRYSDIIKDKPYLRRG